MGRSSGALLAIALVVVAAACVGGSPACDALPTEIELTLTAETLTPDDPAVCRGRDVTLRVASQVDGVFHIHGYDEEVPATTVVGGETVDIEFAADRSGQFPIELHTGDVTPGVSLGILTVHEP